MNEFEEAARDAWQLHHDRGPAGSAMTWETFGEHSKQTWRDVVSVVVDTVQAVPLKLGWSNPDCGPESMRLYATDQDEQPRWAAPHARTAETVLHEMGAHEGSRWLLIPMPPEDYP